MQPTVTTVFVDLMGFSSLVIEDHASLPLLRPCTATSFGALDYDLESLVETGATRLEKWFATFHGVINILVADNAPATGLSAVSFSDSAFVAFEHSNMALLFARAVMRNLLMRDVPARIGIASGSFLGLRYLTDIAPPATNIHASQFLGTSVVLAHHAEGCGLKGFRILLDPDLPIPSDCVEYVVPLPEDEQTLARSKGKAAVRAELAYLLDSREQAEVGGGGCDSFTSMKNAVQHLRVSAPETERIHHDKTLEALWRMHQHLGLALRPNLDG